MGNGYRDMDVEGWVKAGFHFRCVFADDDDVITTFRLLTPIL